VQLNISAAEFQRLYEGTVREVSVRSLDGRRVRFPANILRPFVTHSGISGTFCIRFDQDNRYLGIDRVSGLM
jgi:hypothetical protein